MGEWQSKQGDYIASHRFLGPISQRVRRATSAVLPWQRDPHNTGDHANKVYVTLRAFCDPSSGGEPNEKQ